MYGRLRRRAVALAMACNLNSPYLHQRRVRPSDFFDDCKRYVFILLRPYGTPGPWGCSPSAKALGWRTLRLRRGSCDCVRRGFSPWRLAQAVAGA